MNNKKTYKAERENILKTYSLNDKKYRAYYHRWKDKKIYYVELIRSGLGDTPQVGSIKESKSPIKNQEQE